MKYNGKELVGGQYNGKPLVAVRCNGSVIWPQYSFELVPRFDVSFFAASGGSCAVSAVLNTYLGDDLVSSQDVVPVVRGTSDGFSVEGNIVTAAGRGVTAGGLRSIILAVSHSFSHHGLPVEVCSVEPLLLTQESNFRVLSGLDYKLEPQAPLPIDLSAAGGEQQVRSVANYIYTSGSIESADVLAVIVTSKLPEGVTVAESQGRAVVRAASRGTVVGGVQSGTFRLSHTEGGISFTANVAITRRANQIEIYNTPVVRFFTAADIPAGGGAVTLGVVEFTQTGVYTSGAVGAVGVEGSTVEFSEPVHAPSLGSTIKSRTQVGTLSVAVTSNGMRATKSIKVYQQANPKSSDELTLAATAHTIPASGGDSTLSATARRTYTSGAVESAIVQASYVASLLPGLSMSGNTFAAQNRGREVGAAKESLIEGTYTDPNTGQRISNSITLQQQANQRGAVKSLWCGVPNTEQCPASGGVYSTAEVWVQHMYTSGAIDPRACGSGVQLPNSQAAWRMDWGGEYAGVTAEGVLTINSQGTVTAPLRAIRVEVAWSSVSSLFTIYQAANQLINITDLAWRRSSGADSKIPAKGGELSLDVRCSAHFSSGATAVNYDYGDMKLTMQPSVGFSFWSASNYGVVTAVDRGVVLGAERSCRITCTCTRPDKTTVVSTCDVVQAANYVAGLTTHADFAYDVMSPSATQSGAALDLGSAVLLFSSERERRITREERVEGLTLDWARSTYSLPKVVNGFNLASNLTGVLSNTTMGKTLGSRTSGPVAGSLTCTVTHQSPLEAGGVVATTGAATATCTQGENQVTGEEPVVSGSTSVISSSGGESLLRTYLYADYTSGTSGRTLIRDATYTGVGAPGLSLSNDVVTALPQDNNAVGRSIDITARATHAGKEWEAYVTIHQEGTANVFVELSGNGPIRRFEGNQSVVLQPGVYHCAVGYMPDVLAKATWVTVSGIGLTAVTYRGQLAVLPGADGTATFEGIYPGLPKITLQITAAN